MSKKKQKKQNIQQSQVKPEPVIEEAKEPEVTVSEKPVKTLDEIIVPFVVNFPKDAANSIDPVTRKKAVMIKINNVKTYIPVEEDFEITKQQWSLLKNINFKYLQDYTNDPLQD